MFYLPVVKGFGDGQTTPIPEIVKTGQMSGEELDNEAQETQNATSMSQVDAFMKSEQAIEHDITDEEEGIVDYEKQLEQYEKEGNTLYAKKIRHILEQEKEHKKMLEGMEKGFFFPVKKSIAESSDDAVVEKLAEAIHNMWCGWSVHAAEQVDKEIRERWEKMWIAYSELPEIEKEKDRVEARGLLDLVKTGDVKKSLPADSLTQTVYDYLKENYPEDTLAWVKDATWRRAKIPLSKIKMARRPGGRNMNKVKGIAEAIKSGKKMDPIILVKTKDGYEIADGYHRTLGFQHAGESHIKAYIGEGAGEHGPWEREMHEKKLNKALLSYTPVPNMVWSILHTAGYTPKMSADKKTALIPGAKVHIAPNGQVSISGPSSQKILSLLNEKMQQKQTSEDWVDGRQTLNGGEFFLPTTT